MTSVRSLVVMRRQSHTDSSTVLLTAGFDGLVLARRPRLKDRLVALLRARRLDRALAQGTPPEASAALALRAQRLTEPEQRASIARELRRVMREAGVSRRPEFARIKPSQGRVLGAREQLRRLADMLEDPGPVAASGVAQARILLTDGTGPLYNPDSRTTLVAGAAQALDELRPWPV
jgi:hypothetical protein